MKKPLHLEDLSAALEAKPLPGRMEWSEADYKRQLVGEVNDLPRGYAQRIEDRYAVGALDLIVKLPDLPMIFAEAKVFEGNVFSPTPLQFAKGERIIDAGMIAVLIGWQRGTMYLSPWVKQADKRECYVCYGISSEGLRGFLEERGERGYFWGRK